MVNNKKITIFTIGHSTHSLEQYIELLKHYGITRVIDVRTIPRSRHNPQFGKEALETSLKSAHIAYSHIEKLGGLRHPRQDSINTAWRNASFRGFADYMQTDDFQAGLQKLIDYARRDQVVIMCAEAVPWRCHRSLIGDALLARHIQVQDIFSLTLCKPHALTPWANVQGDMVTYPATQ